MREIGGVLAVAWTIGLLVLAWVSAISIVWPW